MKLDVHEEYKEILDGKHACYVLITCDGFDSSGQMQVEMSYEGDRTLVSYLLKGAKSLVDKGEER